MQKWLRNSPGKRYWRIRICLTEEVETPSFPIRIYLPDVKYPEKVERRPDRIAVVRYPERVGCWPDRIAAVRHPERMGCRPDRIAAVRHPGGIGENFRPGGMSDAIN